MILSDNHFGKNKTELYLDWHFAYRQKYLLTKGLFGILNSSKKRVKKFDLTTMVPQVKLFLFVFWKN